MPAHQISLDRDDVFRVVEKINEVAPPASIEKVARAFGISPQTVRRAAERGGYLGELENAVKIGPRPVDEALKAVADLVG